MDNNQNNNQNNNTQATNINQPNAQVKQPVPQQVPVQQTQAQAVQDKPTPGAPQNPENKPRITPVETKKQPKKKQLSYEFTNDQGNKEKGYVSADTKEEVQDYLENEGISYTNLKETSAFLTLEIGGGKLRISDLSFILTQLSTYLKAGIPLIDSIKILERQAVKASQKRLFANIRFQLVKGESFSNALAAQGEVFPKLLINMVKTAELTGDLPSILDDMVDYYTVIDRTRKQAVSAMTYPIIIFIFSLMVITFILTRIIPEFVGLFEANNAEIPKLTRIVLDTSDFITSNVLLIVFVIVVVILSFALLFKYVKPFRKFVQTVIMKLPIVGQITIYKEVAMFTKTFSSLLNHDVFITDSMAILSTVSNNEVFKEIIDDSLEYLARGAKISDSFRNKWAFPVVAYEMLVTGENTGKLPTMMEYVAKYYEDLHANYVKRINTFIEPIMIIFLAVIVGVVVLSVIIPMFSFYGQIA